MSLSGASAAWQFAGVALKRLVNAGMHQRNCQLFTNGGVEAEMGKRAFLILFTYDVQLSMTLGRPSTLRPEGMLRRSAQVRPC